MTSCLRNCKNCFWAQLIRKLSQLLRPELLCIRFKYQTHPVQKHGWIHNRIIKEFWIDLRINRQKIKARYILAKSDSSYEWGSWLCPGEEWEVSLKSILLMHRVQPQPKPQPSYPARTRISSLLIRRLIICIKRKEGQGKPLYRTQWNSHKSEQTSLCTKYKFPRMSYKKTQI